MHLIENKTVLIVGLGLIGGSVARALAAAGCCRRILASGRDETQLQAARLDGSIDAFDPDPGVLLPEADIVVIATPTLTVSAVLERLRDDLPAHAIVTDVASVKESVLHDAQRILGAAARRFVAGHPIAGSEQSGYGASRADLFRQRKVILTPAVDTDAHALATVMQLWQVIGAEVHAMSARRHDQLLAGTSHLPHLLAYTLVNTLIRAVGEVDRASQVFDYAAGGFADFSRIASSDPLMWRDIFLANRDATVAVLDAYMADLQAMRETLIRGDGQALQNQFRQAKTVRDEFIERFRAGQSSLSSPAGAVSDQLDMLPCVSVRGRIELAASACITETELKRLLQQGGVWQVSGVPCDRETLRYLQTLRQRGVPVSGPEQGRIVIYGAEGEGSPQSCALASNTLLMGLLAVLAAVRPNSQLTFVGAVPGPDGSTQLPVLLRALQELGLPLTVSGAASSCHMFDISVQYEASALEGGARLAVPDDAVSDPDECLVLLAAGLVSEQALEIQLTPALMAHVWPRCERLQAAGLPITQLDAQILRCEPGRIRLPAHLDAGEDVNFALLLLIMAACGDTPVRVHAAGELRGTYPGLIDQWRQLGIPVRMLTGADDPVINFSVNSRSVNS